MSKLLPAITKRLRNAPYGSILLFLGIALVPTGGTLLVGMELVTAIDWSTVKQSHESVYVLGWLSGTIGVLVMNKLAGYDWLMEKALRGYIFMETIHWPYGENDA